MLCCITTRAQHPASRHGVALEQLTAAHGHLTYLQCICDVVGCEDIPERPAFSQAQTTLSLGLQPLLQGCTCHPQSGQDLQGAAQI
jgi:hypothetical protein